MRAAAARRPAVATAAPATGRLPDDDGLLALLLCAIDPLGTGGALLCGLPGEGRRLWLERLRGWLAADSPFVRLPLGIADERLFGGLDFAASLSAGRPVFAAGLLAAADGGMLVLNMAERVAAPTAAALAGVLDRREVLVERDGMSRRHPCRAGLIALDESLEDEEGVAAALADRLAFVVEPERIAPAAFDALDVEPGMLAAARARRGAVSVAPDSLEALCVTAAALGIESARGALLAVAAARALAAWLGLDEVGPAEAAIAARLVLANRARCLPPAPADDDAGQAEDARDESQSPAEDSDDDSDRDARPQGGIPEDVVLEAAAAAIPPALLERLRDGSDAGRRAAFGGKAGRVTRRRRRGRPVGLRQTADVHGERINLLATLKAAAPWQRLRRGGEPADGRLRIHADDLYVTRFEDTTEATTIFAVDASGSQAAQRLAEVKGAVELLLADCYVRRDQVALIAFRGQQAEVLLPPTRALARARRALAALPGGGGTPLAAGIEAARDLAEASARLGRTPAVVFLTDGRANVARGGGQGAQAGADDALAAARLFRAAAVKALLIDTSRRPRSAARELAAALAADYVPLPRADAGSINDAVRATVAA